MNDLDVLASLRPPTDDYDPGRKALLRTLLFGDDELAVSDVEPQPDFDPLDHHRGEPGTPRLRLVVSVAAALVVLIAGAVVAIMRDPTTTTVSTHEPADSSVPVTGVPDVTVAASDAIAPLDLPDGLVVWHMVQSTSGMVTEPPVVEQLFGHYDDAGVVAAGVWVRVQSVPNDIIAGDGVPTVPLRDQVAYVLPTEGTVMLRWVERDRQIDVEAQGLSQAEVVSMLDSLAWRADSADGFVPSSAPPELALIAEDTSAAHPSWPVTTYMITHESGPSDAPLMNGAVAMLTIGPQLRVSLPPYQIMHGVRQADGSIVERLGDTGINVITSDGLQIQVSTQDPSIAASPDPTLSTRILESLRPADRNSLVQLQASMSQRLEEAPQVGSVELGEVTLQLRGGTADQPQSLCLAVGDATACRAVTGSRVAPPNDFVVRSMMVDGRWFVAGLQSASTPAPGLYEWRPNLPTVLPADVRTMPVVSATMEGRTYWLAEIPNDIDDVEISALGADGSITTIFPLSYSSLRRPPG